ncbi:hypothetical protein NSERUTF1_1186 [Nocardia seriolae]|nr:hypothetical protein NSERUTF1_1186 [Nocardia seriolae]
MLPLHGRRAPLVADPSCSTDNVYAWRSARDLWCQVHVRCGVKQDKRTAAIDLTARAAPAVREFSAVTDK